VDLSSLLYDHRLVDASQNSSDILQSTIFTEQYVTLSGVANLRLLGKTVCSFFPD
jgi:hypothetical protein